VRLTETKVGLVVLLAIGVLSFMTFKIGGFSFDKKGYRLFVVFPNVAGLSARAPVQIAGVQIGEVEAISLVEDGARVTLLIQDGVEIRAGGHAAIQSSGLLGDRFVAIFPGKRKVAIQDGETLPAIAGGVDMDQLTGEVSNLISRFTKVADNINAIAISLRGVLATQEGQQSVKDILIHVRSLTRGLDTFVADNRGAMGRSISSLDEFSVILKKDGEGLLNGLTRITKKIESGEGTIGKLVYDQAAYDRLSDTLGDLRVSLQDVHFITEKVRRGEGTLGKLFSDEEAYKNLNRALEGLSDTLGRVNRFKTEVGFRDEYQLAENENKGYLSIKLSPRQDKYYLLEVVDDPVGDVALTHRLTTKDGIPSTVTELETKGKLKVSALFGKRLPHLGLRIGLMENGFGVGTDLYFRDDQIRISLDAWDFNSDDPLSKDPHLKMSAQYDFLRNIHFSAGYDQMLNSERNTLFLGAGLRFEDDDLKFLIGGLSSLAK
jgi:phospholipid/cholesterol/gamma-HCH transport system substrate-binding protein